LIAVSCPTTSLCVAVDNLGNTITSTQPAAGPSSWTLHEQVNLITPPQEREPPSTLALSCPSTRLCVAVNSSGDLETSTSPTGGASDWTHTDLGIPAGPANASCNASSFCVTGLTAVSCKTASFCVAVDADGNAFTSNDPTGGAAAWKRSNVNRNIALNGIACATRSFCVAVDPYGYAVIGRG
jgi:hypothetical protein